MSICICTAVAKIIALLQMKICLPKNVFFFNFFKVRLRDEYVQHVIFISKLLLRSQRNGSFCFWVFSAHEIRRFILKREPLSHCIIKL